MAVECTIQMAHFLVDEARKNYHRFLTPQIEHKSLIYTYPPPTYSYEMDDGYYVQTYFYG
jgi:hypothetical protein